MKGFLAIVLCIAPAFALAQTMGMFKCKNPSGGTEYSDVPCKQGVVKTFVPKETMVAGQPILYNQPASSNRSSPSNGGVLKSSPSGSSDGGRWICETN